MTDTAQLDLITFEVFRHRLWEINDEMGLITGRIAASPVVYETGDFNAAILTPDGRGLFVGVYVIRQASALDLVVQSVIKIFGDDINDGDIFLTSDPWHGALHAMDAAVVAPVFAEGDLVAWTGVVAHELDMGGPHPGSWSVGARNAYQECPIMPPVKIMDRGVIRRDVEQAFLRNSRTPEVNAVNLRAKIASQITTRERLRELVAELGKDAFLAGQQQVLDYVRRTIRARLSSLPDGTWRVSTLLDHDGVEDRIYTLRLAMTKEGDRLRFDFSGTEPQAGGPINCAYSGLVGGILQVLFPLLCFDVPWSHGAVMDCIDIVSEPGTLNNAIHPAATSMATVFACQATGDLVWEAIASLFGHGNELREEVMAQGYGVVNMGVFGGETSDGRSFVNLFTDSVGGGGARSFQDGVDTSGNYIAPAYAIPNVERIESLAPVLYVYRKQRPDSMGAGKFRGGAGLEFMIAPHGTPRDIDAVFFSSGAAQMSTKGVFGGLPGSVQRNLVLRGARVLDLLGQGIVPGAVEDVSYDELVVAAAKDTCSISRDDVWVNFCAGGGGYGDPLDRDPALVVRDMRSGLLSPQFCAPVYGVVLTDTGWDDTATEQLRNEKRRGRTRSRASDGHPTRGFATAPTVLEVGEVLAVRATEGGAVIGCTRCGYSFGPPSTGWWRTAAIVDEPITTFSDLNKYGAVDDIVVREYCCPGCGVMLSANVEKRAAEPGPLDVHLVLGADTQTEQRGD